MKEEILIEQTKAFVKNTLAGAEGGHDWFHTIRVYNNAIRIAQCEMVDIKVVQLAALLHDIADAKFYNGDEEVGPTLATTFLEQATVDKDTINHVVNIIRYMSFKNNLKGIITFSSKEMAVVQDADRLDAIGAIGIARTFNYGGFKNRPIFDPHKPPRLNLTKEEYKNSEAPTINHFYEKLLLLKGMMKTPTGKAMAEKRHRFMVEYLNHFYEECGTMAEGWKEQLFDWQE